jgi:RHS repeat-associated protein
MPAFTAPRIHFLFLGLLLLSPVVLTREIFAQTKSNKQYTENKPDLAMRADARVDPSTLAMSLEIPLGGAPGRAGTNVSSVLRYSSKQWRMNYASSYQTGNNFHTWTRLRFSEDAVAGWTSSLDAPWIEYTGRNQGFNCGDGTPKSDSPQSEYDDICFIARIHLHLPDGSSHELRKSDTPQVTVFTNPQTDFTGNFYSTDGSRMRFDADSGVLYTPDGGRYIFGAEQFIQRYNSQEPKQGRWATQFIDRNGNTLTYSPTSVSDTLGRTYQNPLPNNPTAGDQNYTVPGFGGQNLTYILRWRYLADALNTPTAPSYTSNYLCVPPNQYDEIPSGATSLFPTGSAVFTHICANPEPFNPIVLAEVVLPNYRSYQLKYNLSGEIEKVIFPTGGYERFAYAKVSELAKRNWPYDETNRGVVDRWVSASGSGLDEAHWHYDSTGLNTVHKVTITPPDNSGRTERFMYASGAGTPPPFGFDNPLAGMIFEEAVYDSGGHMLQRSLTDWSTEIPSGSTRTRNPRVSRSTNLTFFPAGDALAASTTMQYDSDGNVTSTSQYDYVAVDSTTAQTGAIASIQLPSTPLRTQETTYLVNDDTIDPSVRSLYRARNLTGLSSSTRVRDSGGTIVAQSSISYDEAAFPVLTYGAVTAWSNPGAVRGNPTSTRTWLNTNNSWLESHVKYDQCGNPRQSWDARDTALANPSEIEYSSAYAYAYPTLTRSPIPDASGQQGSSAAFETTTTFDFYTGRVTSTRDANLQVTNFAYNDPLHRLTSVTRADGSSTSYYYSDTPGNIYVRTQTSLDAGRVIESYQYFDGAARPYRTYLNEGGGNYLVTDTEFDNQGRVWRVSNSYRSNGLNGAINPSGEWTTNAYDALGRLVTVTTSDSAVVSTSYLANNTTVTDQSGKQRMSVSDALGRLIKVYENPGGLNYLTTYDYDLLDNLTRVAQDDNPQQPSQPARTFSYDSLKRLVSAWNPESGTVSYQYDNNGNLTQKTDARGVVSSYTYDALNRNLSTVYTNSATPAVYRYYDGFRAGNQNISNSKGKLWQSETAGVAASRTTIDSFDTAGRPLSQSQQFFVNSTWSQPFAVHREYNLAGGVTLQSYPSGHSVTYNYDQAGRLADKDSQNLAFTGNLGDGLGRTYSRGISYSPLGAMTQEQFGTDTALYNKLAYNSRGQLAEIKASTTGNDSSWNRGKFVNWYSPQCGGAGCSNSDNNGNLIKQETSVPNNEQNTASTSWYQQFDYDSLNRLKWVKEYNSANTQLWQQEYEYDRYGNRTIHQTNTWGPSSGPLIPKPNFEVQTSTNRLYAPGDLALPETQRVMQYDLAGNLKKDKDVFGAAVTRAYDAENRMSSETRADDSVAGSYTYNADGQRVRRKVDGVETWQVYGMDGELLAEYAANASAASPQKEYGYRNGQLLLTAEPPAQSANTASFLSTDTTTQGNWKGVYGADGYSVINDAASYPAYATVSVSGQGSYTWAPSTTDARGLQKAGSTTDRIAACWYSATNFTVDVNLTDGITHRVALYTIDWDGGDGRQERIEVLDAESNAVLDSREVTLYTSGKYLVWTLKGHVKVKFTHLTPTGYNAVMSGIFFGGAANSATFVTTDTATQGNWKGVYGADGYNVVNDATNYPAYATVSVSGQGSYTWAATTSDVRGLRKAASTTERLAACWYSPTNFTIDVNLTDGSAHRVALYTIDWDGGDGRQERIEVLDADTNAVLDSREVTLYTSGKYLVWTLKGHVKVRLTHLTPAGYNAVVSGLFFGAAGGAANSATFVTTDTATQGNWKGVYGSDGYSVINDASSYPAYATVSVTGQGSYTWAPSTTDARGLQKAGSTTDRIAACWYSATNFTVDVNLTDGNTHRVALYTIDWDGGDGRQERIEVLDAESNAVLDSREVTLYTSGKYLVWTLKGHVKLKFTHLTPAGYNAVVSGLFFDAVSSTKINWLVTDQLGTPRMIFDKTGSLAATRRHDYLPFGEELVATQGARSAALGYGADSTRQKFTSKERDVETGLDYFVARYYSSTQGRFSGVDPYNPILQSADEADFVSYLGQPQKWNRYGYATNNPLRYVDPSGEDIVLPGNEAEQKEGLDHMRKMLGEERFKLVDYVQQNVAGVGMATVISFGSDKNRQKFEGVGGTPDELEFSQGMSDIIGSSQHTEYKLAETFQARDCIGRICMTETRSTSEFGGAATLNKDESLTGNVQIFVSRNAPFKAMQTLENQRQKGRRVSNDADALTFTPEQVDGHEFGHAYNSVRNGGRVDGPAGTAKALRFETIIRRRQGSSNERIVH